MFLALLSIILAIYTLYDDSLSEKSHKAIIDMQKDYPQSENTSKVSRAIFIETYSDGIFYLLVPFFIYPFVCRQRFFYYLGGICASQFIKSILKLSFHAPRPLWLWSDIQCYAKEDSFASPSGHTIDASFLVFLVILDTFFASNYSRRMHPSSNAFSLSGHMVVFLTVSAFGLVYIYTIMQNRLFLGKHSYDQVLLGLQIGVWFACYLHFCWRD